MNKLITFSTLALIASLGLAAQDGTKASASANASVKIVSPLKVTNSRSMWFGEYIVDPTVQATKKIILEESTTGVAYSSYEGVQKWGNKSGNGEPHTARFHATGEKNYAFLVTTPQTITMNSGEGTGTLALVVKVCDESSVTYVNGSNWTIGSFTKGSFEDTLSNTGAADFYVGGELTLGANSKPGLYSGTFQVDVQYN